ncbi:MAG: DUF2182 domain-containing protein [Capsulimonadaceae bacterium]
MGTRSASQQTYMGVLALLFAAGTLGTVELCRSMSTMGGMEMPGGWTMSMAWMMMPGQTSLGAESSFVGMWVAMMAAMMLPSLVPMLGRYRAAVAGTGAGRLGWLTALVGGGYFFVWTWIGAAVYPLGFAVSNVEMAHVGLSRAVPLAVGLIASTVGALQFTPWKARQLACCNKDPRYDRVLPATGFTAWRHGLCLGLRCAGCCSGLMALQVILGIMDLRLMAVVTAAITAERLAPNGARVARWVGYVVVVAGIYLIARAVGLR